jgi:hypothetical protein
MHSAAAILTPMKTIRLVFPLLILAACTDTEQPPGDDDDLGPGVGPVAVGEVDDIDPVEGFALDELSAPATSAVAAVAPDGSLFRAYIDGISGWPVVIDGVGQRHELPGGTHPEGNDAIAMVGSADGAMHVVSSGGGIIYYARLRDGVFDPTQSIAPVAARDATVAIAPGGDLVVAYVAEAPEGAAEPDRIQFVRGVPGVDGVQFGAPTVVNPECCVNEHGEPAEAMSAPSLAIGADGSTHVVYEWTTWSNTTIEYVNDVGGALNPPVKISEAAFVPCPSLAVDADNKAFVTFLEEPNRDVFLIEVDGGAVSERRSLYTTQEYLTMSMMVRDGAGRLHVLATDNTAAGGRLLYVAPDAPPDAPATEVTTVESPGFVEMTPRAGGLVVSPNGRLLVGYERVPRWSEMGAAEVAVSR